MNEIFNVGEVAILKCCKYAGQEVTILQPMMLHRVRQQSTGEVVLAMVYATDFITESGVALGALPEQLRKKPRRESWSGEERITEMFTPAAIDAAIKIDLMALLNSVK